MKYVTVIYNKSLMEKCAKKSDIELLKDVRRRTLDDDEPYSPENILENWRSEIWTGFFLCTINNRIYLSVVRIPEFEEFIKNDNGCFRGMKSTKSEKENAECYMTAYQDLISDECDVEVAVLSNLKKGDFIPIAIPEDLDAYEVECRKRIMQKREREEDAAVAKETFRRSQPMTITVGMWESLLERIRNLEERN